MSKSKVKIIPPSKIKEKNNYETITSSSCKRVCAYARVSTDSDEQINSYKSQVRYYEDYIKNHEGWIFAGVYADEGVTGTSMKKRKHFRQMIDDAQSGKIDMIICKSLARFARSVVDILNIIESLSQKGIPIIFENERINTLDEGQGSKLLLLLNAVNAEEYSQSLSQSIKWGIRRQIEQGNYPFSRCYGYRIKNKKVIINEKEGETVRFIYSSFLNGDSYRQIARKLEEREILSPMGNKRWHACSVIDILSNVRYKGDLHLQKTTTSDIKFRKQIKNDLTNQYYISNHHQPIVSKEEWEEVEKERKRRKNMRGFSKSGKVAYSSKYPFSNKIICQKCGSRFRRHGFNSSSGETIPTWVCVNHKINKTNCSQLPVMENRLKQAFVEALIENVIDKEKIIEKLSENIYEILKLRKLDDSIKDIDEKINLKQEKLVGLVHDLSQMNNFQKSQDILKEIELLNEQKITIQNNMSKENNVILTPKVIRDKINSIVNFNVFSDEIFRQVCEKIKIDENLATFYFFNKQEIKKVVR